MTLIAIAAGCLVLAVVIWTAITFIAAMTLLDDIDRARRDD